MYRKKMVLGIIFFAKKTSCLPHRITFLALMAVAYAILHVILKHKTLFLG